MCADFDLSTFAKPVIDKIEQRTNDLPLWVLKGAESTKLLYHAVLEKKILIEAKINQGGVLLLNERRIVNRQIAIENHFDPSLITKRRQPDLISLIVECNRQLEELWEKRRKRPKSGIKGLSRSQLESEIKILRIKNAELEESFCRDSIQVALKGCFMEDRLSLSSRIADLEVELESKQQTIVNLRTELRKHQVKSV